MSSKNWSDWWILLPIGTIVGLGSLIGIISNTGTNEWFQNLERPSFTPPNWLFSVAWTVLYSLMGAAAWFILKEISISPQAVTKALCIFGVQLLLNFSWSPLFSIGQSLLGSLLLIGIVDVFALWATVEFLSINKISGALMVPYLLWLSLATALNYEYARLNNDQIM